MTAPALDRPANRVQQDKRTAIHSDPNNPDDPEYIVRLVGQVVPLNPPIP